MTYTQAKLWVMAIATTALDCMLTIVFVSSVTKCLTFGTVAIFVLWYIITFLLGILAMGLVMSKEG